MSNVEIAKCRCGCKALMIRHATGFFVMCMQENCWRGASSHRESDAIMMWNDRMKGKGNMYYTHEQIAHAYQNDARVHAMVKAMEQFLIASEVTPAELRAIANFACFRLEQTKTGPNIPVEKTPVDPPRPARRIDIG